MSFFGPKLKISQQLHQEKYRIDGESFEHAMRRIARALSDSSVHEQKLLDIFLNQRFLPAGRIQTGAGSGRDVTLYNCFVSADINDNFTGIGGIMERAAEAAETMRRGGGVGYNFGTLRPRGEPIKSLGSVASGPVSFMHIYDAICKTVSSAGHRRGAQMGILPVDHPDIYEFVRAKQNSHALTAFNISVGITDEFMKALINDEPFALRFNGTVKDYINPKDLWDEIMMSTWDYAEPGVIFIDRINEYNNLWYCENIQATNPCSEQPLPPNGACLLGSFNLVKYIKTDFETSHFSFDYALFNRDIKEVVRAMDNVIDISLYPLPAQKNEALSKRRMGLGITGFANTSEILGRTYGSYESKLLLKAILRDLRDTSYHESCMLAKEKGAFPMFTQDYLKGKFVKTLPLDIQANIAKYGIRNSHLISIAPTGTISICADNVSSGIEPVFSHSYTRKINTPAGQITEEFSDYAYREFGIKGRTANQCTAKEHLEVLLTSQEFVDSAVSKTCNVSPEMPWNEFKNLYLHAWQGGAKGLSTFNVGGKRMGILTTQETKNNEEEETVQACFIDPVSGSRTCG